MFRQKIMVKGANDFGTLSKANVGSNIYKFMIAEKDESNTEIMDLLYSSLEGSL